MKNYTFDITFGEIRPEDLVPLGHPVHLSYTAKFGEERLTPGGKMIPVLADDVYLKIQVVAYEYGLSHNPEADGFTVGEAQVGFGSGNNFIFPVQYYRLRRESETKKSEPIGRDIEPPIEVLGCRI